MLPILANQVDVALREQVCPSKTFRLRLREAQFAGMTDGLEAVMQAAGLILSTERYQYLIYGWDYGIETIDLIGKSSSYAQAELKRRIAEALLWDERIISVENFAFTTLGKKLSCWFTIKTAYGEGQIKKEVEL